MTELILKFVGLVEGIFNNLYYSKEIIQESCERWKDKPVLKGHYDSNQIGIILETTCEIGKLAGKMRIDDPSSIELILNRLKRGDDHIPLSTGMYVVFDGRNFVVDLKPDHIALLFYDDPACNYWDGCYALPIKNIKELEEGSEVVNNQKINEKSNEKEVFVRLNTNDQKQEALETQKAKKDVEKSMNEVNLYFNDNDLDDNQPCRCGAGGEPKTPHDLTRNEYIGLKFNELKEEYQIDNEIEALNEYKKFLELKRRQRNSKIQTLKLDPIWTDFDFTNINDDQLEKIYERFSQNDNFIPKSNLIPKLASCNAKPIYNEAHNPLHIGYNRDGNIYQRAINRDTLVPRMVGRAILVEDKDE